MEAAHVACLPIDGVGAPGRGVDAVDPLRGYFERELDAGTLERPRLRWGFKVARMGVSTGGGYPRTKCLPETFEHYITRIMGVWTNCGAHARATERASMVEVQRLGVRRDSLRALAAEDTGHKPSQAGRIPVPQNDVWPRHTPPWAAHSLRTDPKDPSRRWRLPRSEMAHSPLHPGEGHRNVT